MIASARLLGEALANDALQVRWNLVAHLGERLRLAVGDLVERIEHVLAGERAAPGDHLVEHAAEREHVGAVIDLFAFDLLGRHVTGRTHHLAGYRAHHRRRARVGAPANSGKLGQLGDAEVEHLAVTVGGNEDVGRLQIAMHDTHAVRRPQRLDNLDREIERHLGGHRSFSVESIAERLPLEVLLHDVVHVTRLAVDDRLAHVEHRGNVRVIESRRRPRLLLEARQPFRIRRELGRQDFDGDVAPEPRVFGEIHLAHTTRTELVEDLVGSE